MNVTLMPLQGPRCHIHDKRGGAGEPGWGLGVRAGRLAVEVVTTPAVFDDRGGAVAGMVTIG
jgi:hypothetical protein